MGSRLGIALFLILFSFQCNQDAVDNFEAVDLSWVKSATDPVKVLGHGLDFLENPSQDQQQQPRDVVQSSHYSCPRGHRSGGVQLGGGYLLGQERAPGV